MIKYYVLLLLCCGCAVFEEGYTNQYGQYVPINPDYELKDKAGFYISPVIDENVIYRMVKEYFGEQQVYGQPKSLIYDEWMQEYNSTNLYNIFLAKGRFLEVSTQKQDVYGNKIRISSANISTTLPRTFKGYYFFNNANYIEIETFVYGEGLGKYVQLEYSVTAVEDTLILSNDKRTAYYVRQDTIHNLPFLVDW
jgi:hypothetical protein